MSPHYSEKRKVMLYSLTECQELFGKSKRTLERRIVSKREAGQPIYREDVIERHAKGAARVGYYDPTTFGWALSASVLNGGDREMLSDDGNSYQSPSSLSVILNSHRQEISNSSGTIKTTKDESSSKNLSPSTQMTETEQIGGHSPTISLMELMRHDPALLFEQSRDTVHLDTDLTYARELHRDLLPALNSMPRSDARSAAIKVVAQKRGVTERTVRRWITDFENGGGISALQPKEGRRDKGIFRVPHEALQVICAAVITNPPATSTRQLHRTLTLAVPDLMQTTYGNKRQSVSLPTVRRIRDYLMTQREVQIMLMNADERKEFLRTYVGRVISNHPNDMWQQDMTRCDVFVYDEDTQQIYRPRVQAVIDVFSGCIMGIGFSPDEDQIQADLPFFRALLPKEEQQAGQYPYFGVPKRIYIDNGKTYKSEHYERMTRELGIDVIHSKPYVSHTRGKIERFFGTLHQFEKTLPGYTGSDAANRNSEEIKRLIELTERWAEGKKVTERLLTLREYQNAVLNWLIVDYHRTYVNGKTRAEWFTEYVPKHTLIALNRGELVVHFAKRYERTLLPNSTFRIDNEYWACMGGELSSYGGCKVVILHDQMVLGDARRIVAIRERGHHLRILGLASRAPLDASSREAAEYRRTLKRSRANSLNELAELATEVTDPSTVVRQVHRDELGLVPVRPLAPVAHGQITAVTPEAKPDLGEFGISLGLEHKAKTEADEEAEWRKFLDE